MPTHLLIAGPSASGKSSLASAAAKGLSRPHFCLDRFFLATPKRFAEGPEGPVRNYEDPASYNGEALARMVVDGKGWKDGVVLEGFCLFAYAGIMALPALRFYLDVPFDVCLERRMARRPRRPSDKSFALIGREETARTVEPQKHLPGVIVLDGTLPLASLLQTVLDACRARAIPQHSIS